MVYIWLYFYRNKENPFVMTYLISLRNRSYLHYCPPPNLGKSQLFCSLYLLFVQQLTFKLLKIPINPQWNTVCKMCLYIDRSSQRKWTFQTPGLGFPSLTTPEMSRSSGSGKLCNTVNWQLPGCSPHRRIISLWSSYRAEDLWLSYAASILVYIFYVTSHWKYRKISAFIVACPSKQWVHELQQKSLVSRTCLELLL